MLLEARNISAGYGRLPVVHDVDVDFVASSITALVGPNGAGKSTLLKAIGGVVPLMAGSIRVNDFDLSALGAERRVHHGLALVPQTENVFPTLTVTENLEMGGYLLSGSRKKLRERLSVVLEIFPDLVEASKKKAGELSGGQRNMLALARALMVQPTVLMLDEPTAGLAPMYVSLVWDRIEAITATGVSILIVEQNVEEALAHADNVYVLVAGRVALKGARSELARYDLSAIFLGSAPDDAVLPALHDSHPRPASPDWSTHIAEKDSS